MRRLLLLRHAKTERLQPGGRDHDRVLAERGRSDAPNLGLYMTRHGLVPDRAIVSTAARTRETWDLVAAEFKNAPPVSFDDRLYDATPKAILAVVKEAKPELGTLLLVGHNPGMQELAAALTASGNLEARQRLHEGFPTSGLAVIEFALEAWSRLHPQSGRLERFVTPRTLRAATD
jgi:phosphohistidine phosphatase